MPFSVALLIFALACILGAVVVYVIDKESVNWRYFFLVGMLAFVFSLLVYLFDSALSL